MGEGSVRYRLLFQDAPWLDSSDFVSDRVYEVGDSLDIDEGKGSTATWNVAGVIAEEEGVPDTLVMVRPGVT